MKTEDFNAWWTDFAACFPDVATWIAGLTGANGVRVGAQTLERWRDVMADAGVDLADAKAATRKILGGQVDRPYREDIPATICRLATQAKRDRRGSASTDHAEFTGWKPQDGFPAGKLFRRIKELRAGGATVEDASRTVFAEWERVNPTDPLKGPRFKCARCLDGLMVQVVDCRSDAELEAIADGKRILRTAGASCSCHAAKFANGRRQRPFAVYDPMEHVLWKPGARLDDLRAKCAELAEERVGRKRVASFDAWNDS